jgi:hypothetical protein
MKKYVGRIVGVVVTGLALSVGAQQAAAGTFTIVNPGPADSATFNTSILNNDGFDLLSVLFDLTNTVASNGDGSLTFGGGVVNLDPTGGTSSLFVNDIRHFGFNFTGFNSGESFDFFWDPDTEHDSSYGALVAQMAGTVVTLTTSGGVVSGTMLLQRDGSVSATINSPVPEPASILLFGAGLVGVAAHRMRRRTNI